MTETAPPPDSGFVARHPSFERKRDIVRMNESVGGTRSYEVCRSEGIEYKMPGGTRVLMHTVGCNEEARIFVPYRRVDGENSHATICMNDDSAHLWPRFTDRAAGRALEDA